MNGDKFISDDNFYIDIKKVEHRWNMGNFHYHNSYEIYYLSEGNRKMLVKNKVYELLPNDIVLLRPNVMHRSMHSGTHTRVNIVFTDEFISSYFSNKALEYLLSCFETEFIRLNKSENEQFRKIFSELSDEYNKNRPFFINLAEILKLFINAKIRQEKEHSVKRDLSKVSIKINSVISYIATNYGTISSIDEIADACYINKSYMCRLFKKETGLTVFEYLTHIKIHNSCEMMRSTNSSLTDIALQCGFSSPAYFSYTFKELTGCTPSQFRNSQKNLSD